LSKPYPGIFYPTKRASKDAHRFLNVFKQLWKVCC